MASELSSVPPDGQLLIYQDGDQKVKVRIDGQTVWRHRRNPTRYPFGLKWAFDKYL